MGGRSEIWVFAEQWLGRLEPTSLELVSEARGLANARGMRVVALLLGSGVERACGELLAHGADRVYLCDDATLEHYRSEPYSAVITRLARREAPEILLMGATTIGRDLAPTVAAQLGTGLSADCTRWDIDENGLLLQVVPAFGGAMMATIVCPRHRPQMATVRPRVFQARRIGGGLGEVVRVAPELSEERIRIKVLEVAEKSASEGAQLDNADVIVAGGAGIGSQEGWQMLRTLAREMGAAVGATRPSVDDGYAVEEEMIGQSGRTVRPKLYIGLGISGETQHLVGVRDAAIIVAVNRDPRAKIFESADYGIVGDYRDLVPRMIQGFCTGRAGVWPATNSLGGGTT